MEDFDQRAIDWDTDPVRVERARVIADAIKSRVPLRLTTTAFEYGCGTGLLSFALQPFLSRITLVDSSEGMLEVLKEKIIASNINNMTPAKLDLSVDPLPQERYNLIYTLMTLHHISDTDKILKDFQTLLGKSGYLCIADLDKEDGSFHGSGFAGHRGFDRKELTAKLEKVGFQNISFTTVYQIIKKVDDNEKIYPLFLMIAEKKSKPNE